ncbi:MULTISPECIES: hypothetical protein [Microbispora]|uniref:Uncharacterized protein n=2 Tax=Microbispora TaxID=2005 RepID=A0ABY3LTE4_9ACTN|nr:MULTISPECIES: hypothetical protein [Microbispora]TLP66023.1 hypothetical protein FED44_00365 [Microbispora fusca]TYB53539.1 hypothetical protein FXF59_23320 [Microbispora tritici]
MRYDRCDRHAARPHARCDDGRRGRLARRADAGAGEGFSRARRSRRFAVRHGWFAHRGGVCRCGQTYQPARPLEIGTFDE